MTVIAYHAPSRTIACDSLFNDGSRRFYGDKFRMVGKHTLALFAGDNILGNRAFDLLSKGYSLNMEILKGCDIIEFNTKTGTCYEYTGPDKKKRIRRIDAWGSGQEFAIGALAAGADASYAVTVACTHSTTCGGKVHTFRSTREANPSGARTRSVPVRQEPDGRHDGEQRGEGSCE